MLNLNVLRERIASSTKPFAIFLTDGRSFVVPHPDFIAVGRGVVSLIDGEDIPHNIDALHIVSISELKPKKTQKHN